MNTSVLTNILAALRALHLSHWTAHWQATNYQDHILMQRLYEAIPEEIDTLAEKIVAVSGGGAVDMTSQMVLMHDFFDEVNASGETDGLCRALFAEKLLQSILKNGYAELKESGMSLGVDDFIMATADAHDTAVYLLQQSCRGRGINTNNDDRG